MKYITVLILVFFFSSYSSAQDRDAEQPGKTQIKKDLLLSSMQAGSQPEYNFKDKLLMLNSKEENEKAEQLQVEKSVSQAEDFKLTTGLLYFAGAAAVAAIIYFLVPDNEPSSEKTFTFGLPVTPK